MVRIALLIVMLIGSTSLVRGDDGAGIVGSLGEPLGGLDSLGFMYEGTSTWLPAAASLRGLGPDAPSATFQGVCFLRLRPSRALLLDIYSKESSAESGVNRTVAAFIDGVQSAAYIASDKKSKGLEEGVFQKTGSFSAAFSTIYSPSSLFPAWNLWQASTTALESIEVVGHEVIGAVECTKLKRQRDSASYEIYWVDSAGTGRVMMAERYFEDQLISSTHNISYRAYPDRGSVERWIPIRGSVFGYEWQGRVYDSPINRLDFEVIAGSVQINAHREPLHYRVKPRLSPGSMQKFLGFARAGARQGDLQQQFEAAPSVVEGATDPLGHIFELEAELSSADEQARQLEAVRPAALRHWVSFLSLGFAAAGFVLLLVVLRKLRGAR